MRDTRYTLLATSLVKEAKQKRPAMANPNEMRQRDICAVVTQFFSLETKQTSSSKDMIGGRAVSKKPLCDVNRSSLVYRRADVGIVCPFSFMSIAVVYENSAAFHDKRVYNVSGHDAIREVKVTDLLN